jgi:hypothetical protein
MLARHSSKKRTCAYYRAGISRLLAHRPFAGVRLDRVDEGMIENYAIERQKAHVRGKAEAPLLRISSINREPEVLRRCLRVAAEMHRVQRVPQAHRFAARPHGTE